MLNKGISDSVLSQVVGVNPLPETATKAAAELVTFGASSAQMMSVAAAVGSVAKFSLEETRRALLDKQTSITREFNKKNREFNEMMEQYQKDVIDEVSNAYGKALEDEVTRSLGAIGDKAISDLGLVKAQKPALEVRLTVSVAPYTAGSTVDATIEIRTASNSANLLVEATKTISVPEPLRVLLEEKNELSAQLMSVAKDIETTSKAVNEVTRASDLQVAHAQLAFLRESSAAGGQVDQAASAINVALERCGAADLMKKAGIPQLTYGK